MKTRKFEKKLVLSKKTVANLDNAAMLAVHGGDETGFTDCRTRCATECCDSLLKIC